MVHNSPPDAVAPTPNPNSATSILNPVLGGLYGIKLSKDFKLGLFLGLTLPVGSGGGTNPNKDKATANAAGIATRSAMDNAMFAVNYFTIFPGVDLAFVKGGFTAQVEATIFQLTKTRGPEGIDESSNSGGIDDGNPGRVSWNETRAWYPSPVRRFGPHIDRAGVLG